MFDEVISAAKQGKAERAPKHKDVQTPKHKNIQTSKSKKTSKHLGKSNDDSDYVRTTCYLRSDIRDRLRIVTLKKKTDMSEVFNELAEKWLEENE